MLNIYFVADSVYGSEAVERSKAASFSPGPHPPQERLTHNQMTVVQHASAMASVSTFESTEAQELGSGA